MSINNTTLLGLAQPVTGQESGVWGDDVNNGLTELVEIAIAGVNNITQDSDITLAVSNGSNSSSFTSTATNSTVAQYYVLNCSGSRTAARNIIVPTTSKTYVITNATTGGYAITIKKSAGTGVTIANGETAIVFYNTISGDVAKVSSLNTFGAITATSITNSGLTSGRVVYSTTGGLETDSANFTFNGTTATINTLNLTNALGTAYGGTGLTSFTANGVVYASSTSALATGSALTFNGTTLGVTSSGIAATFTHGASSVWGAKVIANGSTELQFSGNISGNNGPSIRAVTSGGAAYTSMVLDASYIANSISGSEQMRLTSTGLGIGTSSPSYKLEVATGTESSGQVALTNIRTASSTASYNAGLQVFAAASSTATSRSVIAVWDADGADASGGDYFYIQKLGNSGDVSLYQASNANILFGTNGSERMRIDSSGNLGLGVTPSAWYASSRAFQFGPISSLESILNASILSANVYRNASAQLTYLTTAAAGQYAINGNVHSWNIAPSGTAGNAISFTQAMTLNNSGQLMLGVTSPVGSAIFTVATPSGSGSYIPMTVQVGLVSDGFTGVSFRNPNGQQGSISINSTTVSYNTSSDQRLKTNIVDAPNGNIDSIKVRSFDWIAGGSHQEYGMIAQELLEVAPYAVHQPENSDEMMGVDYSKLVPMMIKEIQSLKAEVATLKGA